MRKPLVSTAYSPAQAGRAAAIANGIILSESFDTSAINLDVNRRAAVQPIPSSLPSCHRQQANAGCEDNPHEQKQEASPLGSAFKFAPCEQAPQDCQCRRALA